jgi:tetratricopeptide (TPR) repeat protein
MPESKAEKIARLLQDGLDHYGEGRSEEAERCWGEVLFLDPDNRDALDYMDSLKGEADLPTEFGRSSIADDALRLMREGHLEASLELFETLTRREGDPLEIHGYLEMVRGKLLERYREQVGGLDVVPQVELAGDELMRVNLPATTGFLLSLVDGHTSVNDLISLSGMDAFDTLRTLTGLLDAGVVRCPR